MSDRVVLVVDDDAALHTLLAVALRRWAGCHVESARSAAEGKTRAATLRPDLVLLDMTLPDGDGAQLLAELKADPATRDVPVAVLSAAAMRCDREELIRLGAAAVFSKPFRPAELAGAVASLLPHRRPA